MTTTEILEEKLAHLQRLTDDLSDVVARQGAEIDRLTRRVAMLLERESAREAEDTASATFTDQRPPHY